MAKRVALFVADGSEPVEVIAPADALRRGGVQVDIVSTNDDLRVSLNEDVHLVADILQTSFHSEDYDMIIVPGGIPGVPNLEKSKILADSLDRFFAEGRLVASICAGPTLLAHLGLLKGRKATCYPGCETEFPDGVYQNVIGVVRDGNLITSSGPGTALDFGIACLEALEGEEAAAGVASGMLVRASL